jgi:hypothetical protein
VKQELDDAQIDAELHAQARAPPPARPLHSGSSSAHRPAGLPACM